MPDEPNGESSNARVFFSEPRREVRQALPAVGVEAATAMTIDQTDATGRGHANRISRLRNVLRVVRQLVRQC